MPGLTKRVRHGLGSISVATKHPKIDSGSDFPAPTKLKAKKLTMAHKFYDLAVTAFGSEIEDGFMWSNTFVQLEDDRGPCPSATIAAVVPRYPDLTLGVAEENARLAAIGVLKATLSILEAGDISHLREQVRDRERQAPVFEAGTDGFGFAPRK